MLKTNVGSMERFWVQCAINGTFWLQGNVLFVVETRSRNLRGRVPQCQNRPKSSPEEVLKWCCSTLRFILKQERRGLSMHWLTHWGRDKMAAIIQTTFSNAFSWMKMYEFRLRFHWSLFLRVQLSIFHHWFRWWLGAGQVRSHYLNQWWLVYWRTYASLGLNELRMGWLGIDIVQTIWVHMMTSSHGNIFCVTGLLCGEFAGHRWIPPTKASDAERRCFLWSPSQQTVE